MFVAVGEEDVLRCPLTGSSFGSVLKLHLTSAGAVECAGKEYGCLGGPEETVDEDVEDDEVAAVDAAVGSFGG